MDGLQLVDFRVFNQQDMFEHLSCNHTEPSIEKLRPREGGAAYTNHRRPILTLVQDNSPGEPDVEYAVCDKYRYLELDDDKFHSNCTDNLRKALGKLGLALPYRPQLWNLFTNFSCNPTAALRSAHHRRRPVTT
jgi:uncharacterized protein YcgI (DUF1989 family)